MFSMSVEFGEKVVDKVGLEMWNGDHDMLGALRETLARIVARLLAL